MCRAAPTLCRTTRYSGGQLHHEHVSHPPNTGNGANRVNLRKHTNLTCGYPTVIIDRAVRSRAQTAGNSVVGRGFITCVMSVTTTAICPCTNASRRTLSPQYRDIDATRAPRNVVESSITAYEFTQEGLRSLFGRYRVLLQPQSRRRLLSGPRNDDPAHSRLPLAPTRPHEAPMKPRGAHMRLISLQTGASPQSHQVPTIYSPDAHYYSTTLVSSERHLTFTPSPVAFCNPSRRPPTVD